MTAKCEKYDQLAKDVEQCLAKIRDTTTGQLEAFQAKEYTRLMTLDKQLEQMVGAKERAIGALREHMREHGCRGPQWAK